MASSTGNSHAPKDILLLQREYARVVSGTLKIYSLQQIETLIWANSAEDASGVLASKFVSDYVIMHYLFIFSQFSDGDSSVFSHYAKAFSQIKEELASIKLACKRSKVVFAEICKLILQRAPEHIFQGKGLEGSYGSEKGLPEEARQLRALYASNLTDKYHKDAMKEHFVKIGFEF